MIVNIEWLKDYVDITLSPEELADLLTNTGLESGVILGGKALDIELTPNRPDCLSHIGVAREISVLTKKRLKLPDFHLMESDEKTSTFISVEIVDTDKCPRYACRIVKDVNIGVSPEWLVDRLETSGIRSINNVVDISNYVLLEYGHPLHTFDLDKLEGNTITIRTGKAEERLTTLDTKVRDLNSEHLLICDRERPVALAGIMGGENSEVSSRTKDVLIESAYFDPVTVRKSAKSLGLITEASKRFERGADYEGLLTALDRTAYLLAESTKGTICKGIVDAYPRKIERKKIQLRMDRSSAVAGVEFTNDFVERTFEGLDITFSQTAYGYDCNPPTFRPDLEREIDLVEELTRIYGYGRIESDLNYDGYLADEFDDPQRFILRLKSFFVGLGFHETLTNSLVGKREAGDFTSNQYILIQNPLSRDMSAMRTSLFPGLLNAVHFNLRRGETDLSLFEYGNIFISNMKSKMGCDEKEEFCGVICGDKSPKQWKGGPAANDFFMLKGYMKALVNFLHLTDTKRKPITNQQLFTEGQFIQTRTGSTIAEFGIFSDHILNSYDIDIPVYGFQLNIDTIHDIMLESLIHEPAPQYPGISRDLSFIVEKNLSVGDIEDIIRECGTGLLTDITLYDLYEGDQIEKGHKSATFNLFFRNDKRTLKDEEVDEVISKIISETSNRLSAKLR